MQVAKQAPHRVSKLVVADIAPVAYPHARHKNVFAGLNATLATPPEPQRGGSHAGRAHRDRRGAPVPAQILRQRGVWMGVAFQRAGP